MFQCVPQPNPDTGEIDPAQLPDTLPGYLISLKAEFSINGDITHSASSGKMGEALYETMGLYSPSKGWFKTVNRPTAGEYRAIGLDLQGSSPEQAQQLQEQMEATKAVLESGNEAQLATLTKQQMVGDLLSATIYTYFALNNIQDEIVAQTAKITTYRAPSFGVFRTNLNPVYWFGIARDVQFNGLVMDVDLSSHQTVANDNSRERWLAFNKAIGARGSAMEHLVPEQMFSTEDNPAHGISAVKALSLASAQGQKIYTIDQSNLEEALAAISLSSESEAEIRAGVQAGKIATAHESQIEYHGWVGEGYIIIDPNTGSGAYKIAGGDDGGQLNTPAIAKTLGWEQYLEGAGSVGVNNGVFSGALSKAAVNCSAILLMLLGIYECYESQIKFASIVVFAVIAAVAVGYLTAGSGGVAVYSYILSALGLGAATASADTLEGDEECVSCGEHYSRCIDTGWDRPIGPNKTPGLCRACLGKCTSDGGVWPDSVQVFDTTPVVLEASCLYPGYFP